MSRVCVLLAVCGTTVTATAADPERPAWRVDTLHDGDTLTCVDVTGTLRKVRLYGIDAPELDQRFGVKARVHLATLTLDLPLHVEVLDRDAEGHMLVRIECQGRDLNRQMVANGFAWRVFRDDPDDPLAVAERDAKAAGRGLWSDAAPVPPWHWREDERERKRLPVTR